MAVLQQAIIDLTNADGCAVYDRARIRYFTRLWFTSKNYNPGSFLWICDHSKLTPRGLGAGCLQWSILRKFLVARSSGEERADRRNKRLPQLPQD
jgi:hypothetical protein